MEQQPVFKQIAVGAFFGVLFSFVGRLKESNPEPLLSVGSLAVIAGSAVGGVLLYVLRYRVWPKKK
jgi:membrane associated rhomboid family serine protease